MAAAVGVGVFAALTAASSAAYAGETTPKLIAHMGVHYPYGSAPENSLGAIGAAAKLGVPIEIDISLSAATAPHPYGVPFVLHDRKLDRMTNRTGYIWQTTPHQLADTCLVTVPSGNICSQYNLPSLISVLSLVRGAGGSLDTEIKDPTLTWGQASVIVARFEWANAWSWDLMPGFGYPMFLSHYAQPLEQIRKVAKARGHRILTEFLTGAPNYQKSELAGAVMEDVYYKYLTADVVSQLHAMGLQADAYTANSADWWAILDTNGADWVMSDDVVGYQNWASQQP